jgi:hypothetical protein
MQLMKVPSLQQQQEGSSFPRAAELFHTNDYDAPLSMTIPIQEDAFEWLARWLK